MKLSLILSTLCLIVIPASACPNLSGHYVIKGEDGSVNYTVIQNGCDKVEIRRTNTYLDQAPATETLIFIVDGKPHGKPATANRWVGNRLEIGPAADHVYYEIDSSGNLHMSDGRSYPQCNGPCDEVAKRTK